MEQALHLVWTAPHPNPQIKTFFLCKSDSLADFIELLAVLCAAGAPAKCTVRRAHRHVHPQFDNSPFDTVFFDNGCLREPIGLVKNCDLSTLCKGFIGHHFCRTSLCLRDFPGFFIQKHRFFLPSAKLSFAWIFFPAVLYNC